jgi:hypothetical protein
MKHKMPEQAKNARAGFAPRLRTIAVAGLFFFIDQNIFKRRIIYSTINVFSSTTAVFFW